MRQALSYRTKLRQIRTAVDNPVAVPGVRLGDSAPALHTDRSHSLPSLDSATGGGRVAPPLSASLPSSLYTREPHFRGPATAR